MGESSFELCGMLIGSVWKRLFSWKDCVRLRTGDDCARRVSCFQVILFDSLSSLVVDEDLTRFLVPKGGWGTLKVAFEGLEKRLFAIEAMGAKSSSLPEEPSEAMSSSRNGLFLLSFSVNSGSMVERVRSCQPFWALKLAKARQSCKLRATC